MDIEEIIALGEGCEVEYKSAKGGLPKNIWTTYSAFANTNGGIIVLGVEESGNEYKVVGVDKNKILSDFWSTINNNLRVSANILSDSDMEILETSDGLTIIVINVPRAGREQRPLFLGNNPLLGTYRRNFEGDYKCTERDVRAMLSDQATETQDKKILTKYGMDDLNADTISSYRNRLSARNPGHPFLEADTREFLWQIGAWGKSRDTREEGLTLAGLLMFGKEHVITEECPN